MIPIPQDCRLLLVLIHDTGLWAIPEKGKITYIRGINQSRLAVNNALVMGFAQLGTLLRHGLVRKVKQRRELMVRPAWMHETLPAYQITDAGVREVELIRAALLSPGVVGAQAVSETGQE